MPKPIRAQMPGSGTGVGVLFETPTVKLSIPAYTDAVEKILSEVICRVVVKPRKLPTVSLLGVKLRDVPSLSVTEIGVAWNRSEMLVA